MSEARPKVQTLRDSRGRKVPLGKELGRGGQGSVYQVRGSSSWAVKVYNQLPTADEVAKLEALVHSRTTELSDISAWPSATMHNESGQTVGFLMPLIDLREYHESHQLYSPVSRHKHFPKADWAFLVHTARNLARAFAVIHAEGHLMGDVSGRNVMVSSQGTVLLIDTDSFQINHANTVFACPVGTAEFTPPELQDARFGELLRSEQHDLFGVALLIFHLLFEGRHPYAGIHANGEIPSPAQAIALGAFAYSKYPMTGVKPPPATLSLECLPKPMQNLFERAFAEPIGGKVPARPTANEWEQALAELLENIVTCTNDSRHKHYKEVSCPWCALNVLIKRATELSGDALRGGKDLGRELDLQWQSVLNARPAQLPILPQLILPLQKLAPLEVNLPPRPRLPPNLRRIAVTLHWLLRALLIAATCYVAWRLSNSLFSVGLAVLSLLIWAVYHYVPIDWDRYAFGFIDRYRNLERSLVAKLMPAYQAKHDYLNTIESQRHKLNEQLGQLLFTLKQLEKRYQQENAQSEYEQNVERLRHYKDRVEQALESQGREIKKVVLRHSREALSRYLQSQPIQAASIPQLDPSIVSHLRKYGITNAYDLRPEKLHSVPKMTQYGLYALLRWRAGLESFFQYDPRKVPAAAISQAKRLHAHKLAQVWQVWEEELRYFKRGRWGYNELQIINQIRDVKAQIEQCQDALRLLPDE